MKIRPGRIMGFGSWVGAILFIIFMCSVFVIFLNERDWTIKAMESLPWTTFGIVAGAFFTFSQVIISIMIGRKPNNLTEENSNKQSTNTFSGD